MKKPSQGKPTSEDVSREIDRDLQRLDGWIRKYQVDSQRFMAGDLPLPPDTLQDRIAAEFRRLRSSKIKGAAHKFRVGGLEARFNSLLALHGRRLRARELGEPQRRASEERETSRLDPRRGVIIGRNADDAAVDALYSGLYRQSNQTGTDPKRFRAYLEHQAEVIRAKTGCAEIQFRLVDQDGKLKIKAKPIRQRASN